MVSPNLKTASAAVRAAPVEAIVIGASAGGLEALQVLLTALPASYPVPVIVVVHLLPERPSLITEIFGPRCALRVREPDDKEPVAPGIWIAPPGYHLLIEAERTFSLSVDEPYRFSRPSIDVLFETAAEAYGASLLCIVLTGANDDGASGARAVREAGGLVFVQDPSQASWPIMPKAAIDSADPQVVAPLAELADLVRSLAKVGAQ